MEQGQWECARGSSVPSWGPPGVNFSPQERFPLPPPQYFEKQKGKGGELKRREGKLSPAVSPGPAWPCLPSLPSLLNNRCPICKIAAAPTKTNPAGDEQSSAAIPEAATDRAGAGGGGKIHYPAPCVYSRAWEELDCRARANLSLGWSFIWMAPIISADKPTIFLRLRLGGG